MAEPILIDYNGTPYDLNVLRNTVLNNYENYAKRFGYGNNKFLKDYIGLTELLRELEHGNASIETGRLVFNNTYADEKGAFGRTRNKSKHYTNPAWMILDTILGMEAYDPNKNKKKLSKLSLNEELISEIGDISSLTPQNKIKAQQEAVGKILSKYTNLGPEYMVDKDFDLTEYLNKLSLLQKALVETLELDDDNYIFNRLGISNPNKPEEKKLEELKGYNRFKQAMIDSGAYADSDEAEMRKEWNDHIKALRRKVVDSYFGDTTTELDTRKRRNSSCYSSWT